MDAILSRADNVILIRHLKIHVIKHVQDDEMTDAKIQLITALLNQIKDMETALHCVGGVQ